MGVALPVGDGALGGQTALGVTYDVAPITPVPGGIGPHAPTLMPPYRIPVHDCERSTEPVHEPVGVPHVHGAQPRSSLNASLASTRLG